MTSYSQSLGSGGHERSWKGRRILWTSSLGGLPRGGGAKQCAEHLLLECSTQPLQGFGDVHPQGQASMKLGEQQLAALDVSFWQSCRQLDSQMQLSNAVSLVDHALDV